MADLVDCCVYDEVHLRAAVRDSTITHALGAPDPGPGGGAVYQGPPVDEDLVRLLERPELYGPAAWRRVTGPDRRPPDCARDAQRRRIAAWLELQFLWRLAVELCLDPGRPGAASMCVKLVAEPARMWMWLTGGPRTGGRAETLNEALVRIPDEAPALERALALQRVLRSAPPPPLAETLPVFLRLSSRIARTIADQLESAGTTDVELVRGEELALPHGGWEPTGPWPFPPPSRLLPLADWRAIVDPALPDETFAPVAGDATDPETLCRAALVLTKGPYPTLTADGLLLRPYHGGRARLRAIHCPITDPVSFALMEDAATAAFPDATGWSARDTARRGVAEHASWLAAHPMPAEPSGHNLGRLMTAARAALFLESVEAGAPRLPLTGAATARALAERVEGARGVADAAWDAHMTFAVDWLAPDRATVGALDDLVRGLSPYAR
jgi:hypothetical protein